MVTFFPGNPFPARQNSNQLDAPRSDWIELWQGPLKYRATNDRGQFGPGHTIDRINEYGRQPSNAATFFRVSVDETDGAIVIEWLIGSPDQNPGNPTVRYGRRGLGRGLYEKLKDDAELRRRYFFNLPTDLRDRAVGALAIGISIQEWVDREFFNAIHAGQCQIWARVGSKTAPFGRIPADVFLAYKIQSWGGPEKPGAACAELDGEPTLYSIHVAPTETSLGSETAGPTRAPKLITDAPEPPRYRVRGTGGYMPPKASAEPREKTPVGRAPSVKAGRPPCDEQIVAKAVEMKARGLTTYQIASAMRHEPGFSNVQTTQVRELIKGKWKGGRPRRESPN